MVKSKKSQKTELDKTLDLLNSSKFWKGTTLFLALLLLFTQGFELNITPKATLLNRFSKNKGITNTETQAKKDLQPTINTEEIALKVLPKKGVELPITWGDLGKRMIENGVIDEQKFRALFEEGLTDQEEKMLTGTIQKPIVLDMNNSRFILNILWAFGLANKNSILEQGEMTSEKYGGDASKFASTGGWSLSKGEGFNHYSKHPYVLLNAKQQALVDKVSRGIYRPCCGNSTHFPDCNHGMAMLGLLELMAKSGTTEQEMYDVALKVNSFWFPQTYIDLATYFKERGTDWEKVDPKLVLSSQFSSAQGYQVTRQQIKSLPKPQQGGGGCGA